MTAMSWLLLAVALLLLFDALRLRGRVTKLGVLADAGDDANAHHRFITAPGVTLDEATRRAASAYARAHALDVLDLVPRDLPTIRALTLAQLVDPSAYRKERVGPGRSAGHALLVSADVAARADVTPPADEIAFARLARRVKHYGRADLAIAPAERAAPADLSQRLAVLNVLIGPPTSLAIAALPLFWTIIGLGLWLAPVAGLIALGAWHLQPLLVLAGTALAPRDLVPAALLRVPLEIYVWLRTISGRRERDDAEARRPEYERRIAAGLGDLFEPRRETCPLCASRELVVHQKSGDLLQRKPGTFTLERCRACRHIFQNPRLSLAGLDFYYKDFYDGLGEASLEFIFGFGAAPYHTRAKMLGDIAAPRRWLDVGAGHGHFCIAARDDLPETVFDGLDLSASIDEAKRRGWVAAAYRGLFPVLAPELAGRYDAVSMSHYLEHTLDPRVEIEAAHVALGAGGHLLIEVPDPEFGLARVLRRYWLPWFQPQHLHLLSVANLERLLRERGFTPILWHRGKAHQRVDFFFAVWLLLNQLAPARRLPWRWRGAGASVWRALVWTIGGPFLVLAALVDNLAGPLIERGRVSNTYRVVAAKQGAAP